MTDPHLHDLAAFVSASPSSFHAVAEATARLTSAGFVVLDDRDEWPTEPGRYLTVRDGALVAWIAPVAATSVTPFRIVGAHTDSPGFKLKPNPDIGGYGWLQAGVEVYGGPLLNSWLDRELELAGRLAFADGSVELVRTGPFLRFPQLAVHLDRTVNSDGLKLDPQQHMRPIFGVAGPSTADPRHGVPGGADLLDHVASLVGRSGSDVAGFDLMVADTAEPRAFGRGGELFASGRLDNLSSVHAGLSALIALAARGSDGGLEPADIPVLAVFDHEEVGSASPSGAAGPMLENVMLRIKAGGSDIDRLRAFAASWCLSADAGHAVHPNYPERHDSANRPIVNGGPLLKINANQRYSTDAIGAAEWSRACAQAGVPFQEFVSSNAVPCGSTIGPITATRLGIRAVDVGIPLLSMHSARELCGADDPAYLTAAIGAFLAPA